MSVLRGLMLVGSLGKVWSKSQFTRNAFSSLSILAYFKLMDDFENGSVSVRPTIDAPPPPNQFNPVIRKTYRERRNSRQNVAETMKRVNSIIYDR